MYQINISRLTVVSCKAKKKKHGRACSSLRNHYIKTPVAIYI